MHFRQKLVLVLQHYRSNALTRWHEPVANTQANGDKRAQVRRPIGPDSAFVSVIENALNVRRGATRMVNLGQCAMNCDELRRRHFYSLVPGQDNWLSGQIDPDVRKIRRGGVSMLGTGDGLEEEAKRAEVVVLAVDQREPVARPVELGGGQHVCNLGREHSEDREGIQL